MTTSFVFMVSLYMDISASSVLVPFFLPIFSKYALWALIITTAQMDMMMAVIMPKRPSTSEKMRIKMRATKIYSLIA